LYLKEGALFFGELEPFPKENSLLPKEDALFFGELEPFSKENSLFPKEVVFFPKELFLLHGELAWD
jgi:hypothetical protein